MVQWVIELSQFDIKYHSRTAIKAQALADFITEFTLPDEDSLIDGVDRWTIQTDGSSAQTILNDALYKRGFSMPYLKCVNEEEARYILEEIHGGICGDHVGPRSLVNKVVRTGYFWPTMQVDAVEIVKRCDKC